MSTLDNSQKDVAYRARLKSTHLPPPRTRALCLHCCHPRGSAGAAVAASELGVAATASLSVSVSLLFWVTNLIQNPGQVHQTGRIRGESKLRGQKNRQNRLLISALDVGTASQHNLYLETFFKRRESKTNK